MNQSTSLLSADLARARQHAESASSSVESQRAQPPDPLTSNVSERTRRVLASYWSIPEPTVLLSDRSARPVATTARPSPRTSLTAAIRAHAGRPPAFLKLLKHPADFASEYQGLVAARSITPPSLQVRVPAVLHTVEADRAIVLEYIPGRRLTPLMRRRYLALPDWCLPAVRDLGRWLATYHESRQHYVSPDEFVTGHLRLARRYLDDAAGRVGVAEHALAHRLLDALGAAIAAQPLRLTWCHGDLVLNNLIVHERMLYVVDFTRYGVGPPEADLVGFWSSLRREIGPFPFSAPARALLWSEFVAAYETATAAKPNTSVRDLWTFEDLMYETAYASRPGRPFSEGWLRRTRLCLQTTSYLRSWLQERARIYAT